MNHSHKFWITMALLQVVFGLTVFALTREYYVQKAISLESTSATSSSLSSNVSKQTFDLNPTQLNSATFTNLVSENPDEILRLANEAFSDKRYNRAAKLYEKLLKFSQRNGEIYNNLGITLYYLGRSAEALDRLNSGILIDPEHQRTWLTLGFVNKQLGNIEQAQAALTNAVNLGDDSAIRESAIQMLKDLP